MRVKVIEKEVMNPLGESAADKVKVISLPKKINKISYFDNTKPNADTILAAIAESLNIMGKMSKNQQVQVQQTNN